MSPLYAAAAFTLVNLICVLVVRRGAKLRAYPVKEFTVGAALCGPAAVLAMRLAHRYAVDEDSVPSYVTEGKPTAAAPPVVMPVAPSAPERAPAEVTQQNLAGDSASELPTFEEADISPVADVLPADEPVAADVTPAQPDDLTASSEYVPSQMTSGDPLAQTVSAEDTMETPADLLAVPEAVQDLLDDTAQEILHQAEDNEGDDEMRLTPWGTRAGGGTPEPPRKLTDLVSETKGDRTRSEPAISTDEKSEEEDGSKRRKFSLPKLPKRKQPAEKSPTDGPQVADEPDTISTETAEPESKRGKFGLPKPSLGGRGTKKQDPAEGPTGEPVATPPAVSEAVVPEGVTHGHCPYCDTDSYADHYGLCANCAQVFPVEQ